MTAECRNGSQRSYRSHPPSDIDNDNDIDNGGGGVAQQSCDAGIMSWTVFWTGCLGVFGSVCRTWFGSECSCGIKWDITLTIQNWLVC